MVLTDFTNTRTVNARDTIEYFLDTARIKKFRAGTIDDVKNFCRLNNTLISMLDDNCSSREVKFGDQKLSEFLALHRDNIYNGMRLTIEFTDSSTACKIYKIENLNKNGWVCENISVRMRDEDFSEGDENWNFYVNGVIIGSVCQLDGQDFWSAYNEVDNGIDNEDELTFDVAKKTVEDYADSKNENNVNFKWQYDESLKRGEGKK